MRRAEKEKKEGNSARKKKDLKHVYRKRVLRRGKEKIWRETQNVAINYVTLNSKIFFVA